MIPKEIFKKVRNVEIRTKSLVNDLFGGKYQSIFKGQGMTFSEVREYSAGDDIRMIDWNVTARNNGPFIKILEERTPIFQKSNYTIDCFGLKPSEIADVIFRLHQSV